MQVAEHRNPLARFTRNGFAHSRQLAKITAENFGVVLDSCTQRCEQNFLRSWLVVKTVAHCGHAVTMFSDGFWPGLLPARNHCVQLLLHVLVMFPVVLSFGVNCCVHCAHWISDKGTVSLLRNAKAPSLRNDGAFYLGINRGFVSPLLARVEPGGARLRWLCAPSLITKKVACL